MFSLLRHSSNYSYNCNEISIETEMSKSAFSAIAFLIVLFLTNSTKFGVFDMPPRKLTFQSMRTVMSSKSKWHGDQILEDPQSYRFNARFASIYRTVHSIVPKKTHISFFSISEIRSSRFRNWNTCSCNYTNENRREPIPNNIYETR